MIHRCANPISNVTSKLTQPYAFYALPPPHYVPDRRILFKKCLMVLKHPYESPEVSCTLIWMIIYLNYFLSQNLPQLLKITKAFVVENREKNFYLLLLLVVLFLYFECLNLVIFWMTFSKIDYCGTIASKFVH